MRQEIEAKRLWKCSTCVRGSRGLVLFGLQKMVQEEKSLRDYIYNCVTLYKVRDVLFICFFSETERGQLSPASLHLLCLHALPCAPICSASVNTLFM